MLPDSELDRGNEEGGGNFDAQAYVDRVLRDEDLQGVLKVEGRLVNGASCCVWLHTLP